MGFEDRPEQIENVKITSTKLTMDDHSCLTFWVFVEGSGIGVGVGGYCIGHGYVGADEFKAESGRGLEAMMRIMDVVGVGTWEQLPGKYCRIKHHGLSSTVTSIGNILSNKWFDLKEFFSKNEG